MKKSLYLGRVCQAELGNYLEEALELVHQMQ